jgi:hypothetical protein
MVEHPVAVYPDRKLAALAVERGWVIMDGEGCRDMFFGCLPASATFSESLASGGACYDPRE